MNTLHFIFYLAFDILNIIVSLKVPVSKQNY